MARVKTECRSAKKQARASVAGRPTAAAVAEDAASENEEVDPRFAEAAEMRGGAGPRGGDAVGGRGESDDSSGDDGGEESDQDGADGDEGGLASFAGKTEGQGKDSLWAEPTHAEMKGLKEAELHFKSSLLRMQMDELKEQVSVKYAKLSALEAWLHSFKGVLEGLPAAQVSTASLASDSVVETMEFRAPVVHMVGSYLLRTVTRPDLVVDLLLEMPAEILHHKDFLNHKYHDKRQLYLQHLGAALRPHASVASVSFRAFNGDTSKPSIVLKPAGLSGLSGKFSPMPKP